jgi:FlaA1/EpsC-like NDP-sugar epimerase
MGEPVRILDVAERLIRLSGRIPGRDVPIVITGVRLGEKLAEDIVAPDEEQLPSDHPAIVVSRSPVPDRAVVHRTLAELEYLSFEGTPEELARRMKAMAADSMQSSPSARDSAAV